MMNIREELNKGCPLLFDGAMGTWYAAQPGRATASCEQAVLNDAETIRAIHRSYLDAGCRLIKTNTFSLSAKLATDGEEEMLPLLEAGWKIASAEAEGRDAVVFADIGPAPAAVSAAVQQTYIRQADAFLDLGAEHFLLETLISSEGVAATAAHIRARCPQAFILVCYAVGPDGMTREGSSGMSLLLETAAMEGVDAVGLNCGSGPYHMLQLLQDWDLKEHLNGKYLCAMPNAGYPTVVGRRVSFSGSADYFGEQLRCIAAEGALLVGGCCGTSPAHIRASAEALEGPLPSPAQETKRENRDEPRHAESRLWKKLDAGKRVIAVELDPPADDDLQPFIEGVKVLRSAGADLVTIADCPIGRARADSSLLACKLKRELDVEPLPHMTCRDRNLNATKALLLGLSMEGVHNVLLVTGDPLPSESRDEVKTVFQFNSRKLARYISGLNETTLKTPFRMFGALNVNAVNFERQLKMAQEKEECGISGFLTQPVLSDEAVANLKLARSALKGKILAGIFPIISYRNACFLNNEVAGIRVSEEIVKRYEGLGREEAEEVAVELSVRFAREAAPWCDGYYLMTPFRRVELMRRIMKEIAKHGL